MAMAASISLSRHDINVLEKIKDPEANPFAGAVIDSSISRDPHIADDEIYEKLVNRERDTIRSLQRLEVELQNSAPGQSNDAAIAGYKQCLGALNDLVSEHPNYGSARNNRVQILRRMYGDAIILDDASDNTMPLIQKPEESEKRQAASTILKDMELVVQLLSPPSPTSPLSPQAARTLSMAYTQRAAVYLKTAKLLPQRKLDIDGEMNESQWDKIDFEEAASRDLALGGRFGSPIAKGLAVSVNPTAKLCGQIVREAMKKEYGPQFGE